MVGESEDGFAVTTETTAFPNLGFSVIPSFTRRNRPDHRKRNRENRGRNPAAGHPCAFLWIYTSFPATSIEGINVEKARYNSGALLASRDKAAGFEADIVVGVPDSGVGHAIGYADESGIPYSRPIVENTHPHGPEATCRPNSRRAI